MTAPERWASKEVAEAWRASSPTRNAMIAPATERMLDRAGVGPGARVLDLGTGTGDTALLAAERVGPTGSVLATDLSPAMVEATRAAAEAQGRANVRVRTMRADAIDVEPSSFDSLLARLVLMFTDLPRALDGTLRALRAGGRLGALVWSSFDRNPFHRTLVEVARS